MSDVDKLKAIYQETVDRLKGYRDDHPQVPEIEKYLADLKRRIDQYSRPKKQSAKS
jgi:hypothetical protein